GGHAGRWDSRGHFFAAAAEAMRRILIDRARAKGALKRGGNPRRLRLDGESLASEELTTELLDLNDALLKLADEDPPKAELVNRRNDAILPLGWRFRVWMAKSTPSRSFMPRARRPTLSSGAFTSMPPVAAMLHFAVRSRPCCAPMPMPENFS